MKKILSLATAFVMSLALNTGVASASPGCILLRFEDDTRFDKVETTNTLSDLVLEKLLNSGKFNFKETKPINESLEKKLYDEKANELENLQWALRYGDYNRLFEGPGFNEKKAQSIATATIGQYVTPSITQQIGQQHNADYIIQGTIINLGTGGWAENKIANIANTVNQAVSILGSTGAANFLGPIGMIASMVGVKKGIIGVQADMRLIKTETGEVIWQKRITGLDITKQVSVANVIKVGTAKVSNEMHFKAVEDAATKIADTLIADIDANQLFVK